MKRRMLLLGVAVASLGAILAATAMSAPTGSSNTSPSSNVGVTQPQVLSSFQNEIVGGNIPANGTLVKVFDIYAADNDPNYSMSATAVTEVTPATQQVATCDTIGTSVVDQTGGLLPITVAGTDVGDLKISIATAGTNNTCKVGGEVVRVDVVATGP